MFKTVNEQEFLVRTGSAIKYIGIYELDWLLDDNQLDCEGLIVVFEDKQYLIQSKAIGEDDFEFSIMNLTRIMNVEKFYRRPKSRFILFAKKRRRNPIVFCDSKSGLVPSLLLPMMMVYLPLGYRIGVLMMTN